MLVRPGDIGRIGKTRGFRPAPAAPTNVVVTRMTAAGSAPDGTRQALIVALYNALVSAGIMAKLDRLYVTAAHSAAAANVNWASPNIDLIPVNSPAFVADRGYTGNATTMYLDPSFAPSVGTNQFLRDSAAYGVWSRTNTNNAFFDAGQLDNVNGLNIRSSVANAPRGRVNSNGNVNWGAVADSLGHFIASRTSSTLTRVYKDGSGVGSDDASASIAMTSSPFYFMRSGSAYSGRQYAALHLGGGLSDSEVAAFTSALQTYMTAVGA